MGQQDEKEIFQIMHYSLALAERQVRDFFDYIFLSFFYVITLLTKWTGLAVLRLSSWCFIKCHKRTIWTFLAGFAHVGYIVRVKSS